MSLIPCVSLSCCMHLCTETSEERNGRLVGFPVMVSECLIDVSYLHATAWADLASGLFGWFFLFCFLGFFVCLFVFVCVFFSGERAGEGKRGCFLHNPETFYSWNHLQMFFRGKTCTKCFHNLKRALLCWPCGQDMCNGEIIFLMFFFQMYVLFPPPCPSVCIFLALQ